MVQLLQPTGQDIISTKVKDKITKEDYEQVWPLVEETYDKYGKFKWYCELEDFKGWEPSSVWDEVKMDIEYFNKLKKVAIVGDKEWEGKISQLMRPFTTAEVRYFSEVEKVQAKEWIRE